MAKQLDVILDDEEYDFLLKAKGKSPGGSSYATLTGGKAMSSGTTSRSDRSSVVLPLCLFVVGPILRHDATAGVLSRIDHGIPELNIILFVGAALFALCAFALFSSLGVSQPATQPTALRVATKARFRREHSASLHRPFKRQVIQVLVLCSSSV